MQSIYGTAPLEDEEVPGEERFVGESTATIRMRATLDRVVSALLVLVVSLIGIVWLIEHRDDIVFDSVSVAHSGITYDHHSSTRFASGVTEFREQAAGDEEQIHIALRMEPYTLGGYMDLFQTGPANTGIRLELDKSGVLAAVVGLNVPPFYRVFVVGTGVTPRTWHTFDLTIDRKDDIRIAFDGMLPANGPSPRMAYAVNDIIFGRANVGSQRIFDGQIRDGSLSYSLFRPFPERDTQLTIAEMALFFLALASMMFIEHTLRRHFSGTASEARTT